MWFHSEVLSHRCASSLLWMLVLQKCIIDGCVLLLKVFSWHPITGIQDWCYYCFNWKFICYHFLLAVTCAMFAIFHMRSYEVKCHIYSSRFEILRTWSSPQRLLHLGLLSVLGGLSTYCYSNLLSGATVQGRYSPYLAERFVCEKYQDSLFVAFHGFYCGGLFCIRYFSYEWNLLHFSLTEQLKVAAFRAKVKEFFNASVSHVLGVIHWYYLLYITLGYYLSYWQSSLFKTMESCARFSSHVYFLVNINLFMSAIVTGTVLYFVWSSCVFIFSLYATERYEFLIDARSEENKDKVLNKALVGTEHSLLRYLAFLDLRWLAQFSHTRRKCFFAISHPGGHPHQWIALASTATDLLDTFLKNLRKLSSPKMFDKQKCNDIKVTWERRSSSVEFHVQNSQSMFFNKIQKFVMETRLAKFIFDELPDIEALQLFTSCQLEIWTIEALGFFIAASYTEDKYGVIQKQFPQILALLLDLKQCEEKLPVGVMNLKKYAKDSKSLHTGITQRHNLKAAIESTLYRIVLTFKTDIKEVFLPDHYKRQLERYLEFMK